MANESLNLRIKNFCNQYQYEKLSQEQLLGRFSNVAILSQHQPDAFTTDTALIESVSLDNGSVITGLAIKVNGILIKSHSEIDDFLNTKNIELDIEYIFLGVSPIRLFSKSDVQSFISEVKAFFDDSNTYSDPKMSEWHAIKEYINSEPVVAKWKSKKCAVRCYLVQRDEWANIELWEDFSKELKKGTSQSFTLKNFQFINADELLDIVMQNDNQIETTLKYKERLELPETDDVSNVYLLLCSAQDFTEILNTREGLINKSLFNDNVRDYQGFTTVNKEIYNTIKNAPENFIFFNNGITIVCSEFKPETHKLRIKNPQIVNGCQTSSILFDARENKLDISKINVWVKVIATKDNELLNAIVRGTNRQNIVPDEAFETTKEFHKKFEDYINQLDCPPCNKLYYERRAKQYANNPKILSSQKISIRTLTRCSIAALLMRPELSLHHEAFILKEYGNKIFQESHCLAPYYVVMLAYMKLSQAIQYKELGKIHNKNLTHILYLYINKVCGNTIIDISNSNQSNTYCEKIQQNLSDVNAFTTTCDEIIKTYNLCKKSWIKKLNRNEYRMKDNEQFTRLLDVATRNNIEKMSKSDIDALLNAKSH